MSNKKEIKRKIHKLISNNYNGEAQINFYNINKKLNISAKLNQNNADIISKKISNAFDALEQLILDDNINGKKEDEENQLKISSSSDEEEKTNDVNILKSKKIAKTILIPKIDFSDIFEDYINNPLIIKEINKCTKLENHKGNTHIYQKSLNVSNKMCNNSFIF